MSDLLPCPFCGATSSEIYRVGPWRRVQCGDCGGQSNGFDLAKKAADAWNRRCTDAIWTDNVTLCNEVIERCARIADGWLKTYKDRDIQYVSATEYACDAVQDIADAIRSLAVDPAKSNTP